jgi:hypothetical protein
MRRLLFAVVGALTLAQTGCLLNIWSADPVERSQQLLVVSENMRAARHDWYRIWFVDQPSHLTPETVDGSLR